jgi:predicted ribonuclease YlaK
MVRLQHSAVDIFNLVVDTNILLHQLDALQQFVVDIEHHLPFTLQIIVPGIVISELDRRVYSAIYIDWECNMPVTGEPGQTEDTG